MSKIDYQALREAAEKAGEDKWQAKKINGDFFVIRHGSYTRQHGYTSYQPIAEIDCKPVRDFVAKANPATVLELLDELEAAKKRIAELEEREILLPERSSMLHRTDFHDDYQTVSMVITSTLHMTQQTSGDALHLLSRFQKSEIHSTRLQSAFRHSKASSTNGIPSLLC